MILECWCIVRWHHSYDCWAYIHRHLHQGRKMYLKVCTDHNTVFIVFFRQTLDRAAGENLMTLRNGKAAGPDEIPAEAIKADRETATNMLHSLFSKIWEKEEVPAQWKEGIVIMLPNKRDLRDCKNYRGIMLLSRQSAQQSSVGEDERGSRPQALRSAGWLPQKQIMYGPDRQSTHYSGAVAGVELPPLHQLHRLWEGLRQCGQRDAVEAAEALRSPGEDHRPYPLYLPGHELQDRSRRPAVRKLRGQDCSPSKVPAVTISLPSGHRLDHEDHHNR